MEITINTEELIDVITKKRTITSPDLIADLAEYLNHRATWRSNEDWRFFDKEDFLQKCREVKIWNDLQQDKNI